METVSVLYKYVDGAHFFISRDEKAAGLCVAHKDLAKAMEAVNSALVTMFKENHGAEIITTCPEMFEATFQKRTLPNIEPSIVTTEQSAYTSFPWVVSEFI